jgi:hypothetical protein
LNQTDQITLQSLIEQANARFRERTQGAGLWSSAFMSHAHEAAEQVTPKDPRDLLLVLFSSPELMAEMTIEEYTLRDTIRATISNSIADELVTRFRRESVLTGKR